MRINKKYVVPITIAAVLIAAGLWHLMAVKEESGPRAEKPIAQATYLCNGGKSIEAAYYAGPPMPTPKPGEPPTPTGSVHLTLSDGRTMTLHQTISADGIRYSNGNPSISGNETFVFWSKGNGALVLENNREKNYIGCIEVAPNPGNLPQVYESGSNGFSLRYPAGWSLNTNYKYEALGPGKAIAGVKFVIPASLAAGTNLSRDTGLSVEEIPNTRYCTPNLFLYSGSAATKASDNGTDYLVATSSDAGAGNLYEEEVWALPGTNPCLALRYFIHSTNISNYPSGAVKPFDKSALISQFDAIRRTLKIAQ